jgi:hypothetical protein
MCEGEWRRDGSDMRAPVILVCNPCQDCCFPGVPNSSWFNLDQNLQVFNSNNRDLQFMVHFNEQTLDIFLLYIAAGQQPLHCTSTWCVLWFGARRISSRLCLQGTDYEGGRTVC